MDTKAELIAYAVMAIAVLAGLMLLFAQSNTVTAEDTSAQESEAAEVPAEEPAEEPAMEEQAAPAPVQMVDVCHYTGSEYEVTQVEFEHLVSYLVNNPYDSTNMEACA